MGQEKVLYAVNKGGGMRMQFIVHFGKRKRPTNGEVIKVLFSCNERRSNHLIFSNLNDLTIFREDWWDKPYEIPKKVLDIVD